ASSVPTTVTTGGAVTLEVFRPNPATANARSDGGSLGIAEVQAMLPTATVSAGSRAYVRDGVTLSSGSLTVRAGTTVTPIEYSATAKSILIGIGAASGDGTNATASASGVVEAFVGAPVGLAPGGAAGTSVTTGSATIVTASKMTAVAEADGGNAG